MLVQSSYISRENQMTPGVGVLIRQCIRITLRGHASIIFCLIFKFWIFFSEQTTMDDKIGSNIRTYQDEILKVSYFKKTWLPFWDLKLPYKTERQPPGKGRCGLFLRGSFAPSWIELLVSSFRNLILRFRQQCSLVRQRTDKQPFSGFS